MPPSSDLEFVPCKTEKVSPSMMAITLARISSPIALPCRTRAQRVGGIAMPGPKNTL